MIIRAAKISLQVTFAWFMACKFLPVFIEVVSNVFIGIGGW